MPVLFGFRPLAWGPRKPLKGGDPGVAVPKSGTRRCCGGRRCAVEAATAANLLEGVAAGVAVNNVPCNNQTSSFKLVYVLEGVAVGNVDHRSNNFPPAAAPVGGRGYQEHFLQKLDKLLRYRESYKLLQSSESVRGNGCQQSSLQKSNQFLRESLVLVGCKGLGSLLKASNLLCQDAMCESPVEGAVSE